MIYFVALLFCIICVAIFDFHSYKNGKWLCYVILCSILICISGFRYKVGGDTIRYMEDFNHIHLLSGLKMKDILDQGMMPLCYLFFSTCRTLWDSFFFMQFVHACIINIIVFTFIKRNTPYVFSAVLIYLIWSFLEFNTEIIRESLAVCAFLCGLKYLQQKKWLRYYLFCVIALGFHISAIVTFIIPLFYFLKYNWKLLVLCLGAALVSAAVYEMAPELLVYIDVLGADSTVMEARYFSDPLEEKNWHAQALYIIKWFIFPMISFWLVRKGKYKDLYPYFGCVAVMMVLSAFSFYSYAFYRLINYLMPLIWIMTGLAMRSMPSVFKPFSKMVYTHIFTFLLFAFVCLYADYFVTEREDMKKYFPYVSIFDKQEVYRPEW